MNEKTIQNRRRVIHRQMKLQRFHCLLVTKPVNVSYITAFQGDDSWALLTPAETYLITDSRYTEQAAHECIRCKIIERTDSLPKALADLLAALSPRSTLAAEVSTSVAQFDAVKKIIKAPLRKAENIIEAAREKKDPHELAAIRSALKIASGALKHALKCLRPGITELALAAAIDFQIRRLGTQNSFETIVAFGPNASRPHHKPATRKLRTTDTMLIDFGAKYKGYCCDLTRCFTLGKPDPLYLKAYNAVRQAQKAAIHRIRPGVNFSEVDAVAKEVIKSYGLPLYAHGTGHGIGLEVHEAPILSSKSKGKLQPGHVTTLEPAVYIPGKLGIRIEDNILVTASGHEILSANISHRLPSFSSHT